LIEHSLQKNSWKIPKSWSGFLRVRTHIWRWSWNQGNSILNGRKYSEMFRLLFTVRFFPVIQSERRTFNTATTRNSTRSVAPFLLHSRLAIIKIRAISGFIDRKIPVLRHKGKNSRTDPSLWCRKKWPNWRREKPTPEVRNVAVLSPNYKGRERCMTPHTSEGDKFEDPCGGTRSMPKHHVVNGDQGHMNRFDNCFQGARVCKSMRGGAWHCRWVRSYGRWLRNKVEGRLLGNLCWIDIAVEESN